MTYRHASWLVAALLFCACGRADPPQAEASAPPQNPAAATVAAEEPAMNVPAASLVVVNGRALTEDQLAAFEQTYGRRPVAGRWWYDAGSGMFGAEGQGAAGFMYPGHDLGPLAADASKGNTGVFINGRQLVVAEVQYLMFLVGGGVMPGRYWLDGQMNWGYEGNPYPAGNLRQLAAARGPGGGGGENNWSGLVGSGNWDEGGSRGYVSIPGVGPIGSYGVD